MRDWSRDNPELDAEEYASRIREILGECEECGNPIEKGMPHYEIDGILLCEEIECLKSYMKANYGKEG